MPWSSSRIDPSSRASRTLSHGRRGGHHAEVGVRRAQLARARRARRRRRRRGGGRGTRGRPRASRACSVQSRVEDDLARRPSGAHVLVRRGSAPTARRWARRAAAAVPSPPPPTSSASGSATMRRARLGAHAVDEPEPDDRVRAHHERCPAGPASAAVRDAMPNVTSRPNGASAARLPSNVAPPTISSTTSTLRPPLASTSRCVDVVGRRPRLSRTTPTSAPRSSARSSLSWDDAVAITRPAPACFASWTARLPTPPAAAWTTTDSP